MDSQSRLFYAARPDGFGERLRAMVNARAMAMHFGGQFGFRWPDMTGTNAVHHAIAPVHQTFTSEFIAAHHLAEDFLAERTPLSLRSALQTAALDADLAPTKLAIEVAQGDLSWQGLAFPSKAEKTALLQKAWASLGFAPELVAAQYAALTTDLPQRPVALHLRAGDIVYGSHRLRDRFHDKVCPFPIAVEIIRAEIAAGRTPVVFGQDQALCHHLRDTQGVVLASDLRATQPAEARAQAMFDIVLMSRCEAIFAAESGFAILASWIGGVQRTDTRKVFSPTATVELIESALFDQETPAAVSSLQRAFACRHAFVVSGNPYPTEPRFQRLLDHARDMDPENDFYDFVQAISDYAMNRPEKAEAALQKLVFRNGPAIRYLLSEQSIKPKHAIDAYLAPLITQAEHGLPLAALLVSLAYLAQGNPDRAMPFAILFQARAWPELAQAGNKLLSQKRAKAKGRSP